MRKHRPPPADRSNHGEATHPARQCAPASGAAVDSGVHEPIDQEQLPEPEVFPLLLQQIRELGEYFLYYLSAKADGAKLGLRNALFSMFLALLTFVIVASLSVAAIWLTLNGAAEGLGVLCGNRPWAGNLLTGLVVALGLAGGMYGIVIRLKNTARERTVAKYENRQSRQQARYGHNVADRAAAHGPDANSPEPK